MKRVIKMSRYFKTRAPKYYGNGVRDILETYCAKENIPPRKMGLSRVDHILAFLWSRGFSVRPLTQEEREL